MANPCPLLVGENSEIPHGLINPDLFHDQGQSRFPPMTPFRSHSWPQGFFGDPYKCSQLQQVCAEGSIARILWDSLQNVCFVKLNRNVTGTSNCCHDYACFIDLFNKSQTTLMSIFGNVRNPSLGMLTPKTLSQNLL